MQAIGKVNLMNNNMLEQMEIIEKGKCTGCGLCSQVCPVNAIKLCPDTVTGFLYPQIDRSICINCELCKKNCPQMRINCSQENFEKQVYGVVVKDEITRMNSTSGGIFSLLAQSILKDGMGVVVGAAYDKELYVQHIMVHNEEKLPQITRSKYLQSNLCSIYEEIKETLKSGKKVLFSGTPCQVSAIKRFCELNGVIEGLYLVDLLCRGIPSPKANQLYLEQIAKERGSRVVAQYHKDKTYGWRSLATKYELENGTSFVERIEDSDWGKSFICYDYCTRESCFSCSYKKEERVSDITLGDAWKIEKDFPAWADNKGTSFFVVRTYKGEKLLNQVSDVFNYKEIDYEQWKKFNPSLVKATEQPNSRKNFFDGYIKQDAKDFWDHYSKIEIKQYVRYYAKRLLKILRLEKLIRKII